MRSSSAVATKHEIPTLEEQALYQNLCILGIVGPHLLQDGIEVTRTCFRRSNNKALEHVLFRLYIIIEGKAKAQKEFKNSVPVVDRMQQATFYQKIGEWTGELKKDGRLEPSLVLPASALKTNNNSTRLVALLLELSSYALLKDLESTSPGTCQAAYLPSGGNGSSVGGLLEDTLLPGEVRLGISISRAKQKASEFLLAAATGSAACTALEQSSLDFKRNFYELQALMRRQDAETAELTDTVAAAGGTGSPQRSALSSPTSSGAVASSGFGITIGQPPAAGALHGPAGGPSMLSSSPACVSGLQRQHHGGQLDALSLRKLEVFRGRLGDHLQVHVELSKVLHPVGAHSSTTAGRAGSGGQAFGNPQAQQVLHPHQIDGQALSAETAAAAAAEASGRYSMNEQSQRRSAKEAPFRPDSIIESVKSFSSLLNAVAPHVTQLVMAGENAGMPPLVQPPSQPSSHAAHVSHQLQVHENAVRQIAQMSRKLQEQASQYGPFLRSLRQESNRVTYPHCLQSGYSPLDDDFLELGPHLVLPSVITNSGRTPNNPPSIDVSVPDSGNLAAAFDVLRLMNGTPHSHMAASTAPSPFDALSTGVATPTFANAYIAAHSTTAPPYAGTSEAPKLVGTAGFSSRPIASDDTDSTRWPSTSPHVLQQCGAMAGHGASVASQRPAGQPPPSTGITSSMGSGFSTAHASASTATSLQPGGFRGGSGLQGESSPADVLRPSDEDQPVKLARGPAPTDPNTGFGASAGPGNVQRPNSSPGRSLHNAFGPSTVPVGQASAAWLPSMDAVAGLHEDTDFSLLAAEGEHVSQALLAGESVWGSYGGAAPDSRDMDMDGLPVPSGWSNPYGNGRIRGASGLRPQQCLAGPLDRDNSDDVLFVDTNKEPVCGPSSKGLSGGNRTAGLGGVGGVGNGGPFGAVKGQQSPCPPSAGFSQVDSMQISPAPPPVMPYTTGGLGADILALRARMQAVAKHDWSN